MNNRIKEIRKHYGLTTEEFGKKLGVTRTAISNIENAHRSVTEQMFKSICREFNVNEEWLRNGTGEMFKSTDRYDEIAMLTRKLLGEESDSFKNRFISILANLTENEWEILEDKLKQLFNATQN